MFLVLFCPAAACFPFQSSLSQSCEPNVSAHVVLEELQVPDVPHLPAAPRTQIAIAAQDVGSRSS